MAIRNEADWFRSQSAEETAIRSVLNLFEKAANDNNPMAMADLLDEQVVIVTIAGIRVKGKSAFYEFVKKAMQEVLLKVVIRNAITGIRFLRPDVALVSIVQTVFTQSRPGLKENGTGNVTKVMVKYRGKWLIAFAQNTMSGLWQ